MTYRAFVHMSDGEPIGVYLVPESELPSEFVEEAQELAAVRYNQQLHNQVPWHCGSAKDLIGLVQEQNAEDEIID